ncbi:ABC transporter membrane-spanning permease - glutamine transport [Streptococcus sp. DD13]|nr:ABC transporter membrane-spanning permease - glutamine transport [Streptococcus sp. DD13]
MIVQISLSYLLIDIPGAPVLNVFGIQLDTGRLIAGVIVIALNSGAYVSEVVRGGINAVPKGQLEAAYSLGIRPGKAMRYVVLPQAFRNILPALGNEFITIIKDSSLLSTIGVMELWKGVQTVQAATYTPLGPYLLGAFYYLILTTVLSAILKQLEKKYNKGETA